MPTRSINIVPQNGNASVTAINCGTSTPKLGGTIDVSAFPNLQEFRCNSNDITALSGYTNNSNLTIVDFAVNKVTGSIPGLTGMSNLQTFRCHTNQLTGSIPSLTGLSNLQLFACHTNQLTGSIPSLTGLASLLTLNAYNNLITGSIPSLTGAPNLLNLFIQSNQLTGSIPSLTGLSNLRYFYCNNQLGTTKLTGSIPSLSGLSNLQSFDCTLNQLTSFAGGSVSATLGDFRANVNLLSASAVNAILAAFVAANKTTGTRVLNLGGTGNAAPTGQGLTDVTTLRNRGWSVTTN